MHAAHPELRLVQRPPDPVQQTGRVMGADLDHGRQPGRGRGDRHPRGGRHDTPAARIRGVPLGEAAGDVQRPVQGPYEVGAQPRGLRQGAVLGGDPPVQQQHGVVDAVRQVQGAQFGGADGEAVHGEHTGNGGQHAPSVRYGDEQFDAERLRIAGRLLLRRRFGLCAQRQHRAAGRYRLDGEPLLLGGGRGGLRVIRYVAGQDRGDALDQVGDE